jgi:hypothetical protein
MRESGDVRMMRRVVIAKDRGAGADVLIAVGEFDWVRLIDSDYLVDTPTARSGGILASPRAACRCRSYTRSTSVLRLGMPYRDEYSNTFVSDVFGRVMISIMANSTSGTSPKTI